jgi:DtxR family Mn-dependent transcriptional regulator
MFDPLVSLLVATLVMACLLALFWPERGFFWRWQQAQQLTQRVLIEDALKHIYTFQMQGHCPTVESIGGALNITTNQAADLLSQMEGRGLLQRDEGKLCLTSRGREYALQIIRAHRLWERYLADKTGFTQAEWHDHAHRYEHKLSRDEIDALEAELGYPTHDPHGDPIPTANGEVVSHGGRPLIEMPLHEMLRIVHLEDEPGAVYAQLVAEGLHPGMPVQLLEISPQRVQFWADGDEHLLAPIVAANISVIPLPKTQEVEASPGERLSSLGPGARGTVVRISHACRDAERRRLMDLGVLPGTLIQAEMISPSGDPTAYRVRDALIALRREQADLIYITPQKEVA